MGLQGGRRLSHRYHREKENVVALRAVLLLTAATTPAVAAVVTSRQQLGIFAFDEWPIYNGSSYDYTHWDWGLMAGQFAALPYGPWTAAGQGSLYKQAAAAGVQLMHENHAVYTEALMPHLANRTARAAWVAREAAAVMRENVFAGTVVDFENIAGACPADPASCVAGFTALVAELRSALQSPRRVVAAALPYTPVTGYYDYVGLNRS